MSKLREEAAKAEPEEYEYELWGAVAGAPGGRWSVTQVNPEVVRKRPDSIGALDSSK
jgi:hypothetical protein